MLELKMLCDNDVSLVETWLNREHVKRWFEVSGVCSIDDWMLEINGRNEEFQWLTHLIVMWQGHPIGFCIYYKCVDSNEDFGDLSLSGTYGIGYLIGEQFLIGKGLGKRIINLLVTKIFSFPDATKVIADPDKGNKASERALLSNGFTLFDTVRNLYVIEKTKNLINNSSIPKA